jgi:hypothetical protein
MGYCVQHGIRLIQKLQIPKLEVKIKTSGLIKKNSQVTTLQKGW